MPMWHKKFPPCYKTEREHTTEYFCFFYCLLDRGHFKVLTGGSFFVLGISQKSGRRGPKGRVTQDTMSARGLGQAASTSALRRMGTSRHCLPVSILCLFYAKSSASDLYQTASHIHHKSYRIVQLRIAQSFQRFDCVWLTCQSCNLI